MLVTATAVFRGVWQRAISTGAVKDEKKNSTVTGVVVDCGSGHTSITYYSCSTSHGRESLVQRGKTWLKHTGDGGNLPLTDVIPGTQGGCFVGQTLVQRVADFIVCLQEALARPLVEGGEREKPPDILLIGGTGGMRSAVEEGKLASHDLDTIRTLFVAAFGGKVRVVKFEVITGGEEATWEHQGAQLIWGGQAAAMFPDQESKDLETKDAKDAGVGKGQEQDAAAVAADIGLFSGGGKSMQLGRRGTALSFPFSTFPKELEERQGAAPDAWLDPAKWAAHFADALVAKVTKAATLHPPFTGRFVGTAMNHRAAMYTGISERPITAGAAVAALRDSLPQFIGRKGELYDKMMATHTPGSNYPLERITAMHTFRLKTVLERMFDPHAQLFFAKDGKDARGNKIDAEWTVGAFAEEARKLLAC